MWERGEGERSVEVLCGAGLVRPLVGVEYLISI